MLELTWREVKRFHDAAWKNQEAAASLLAVCSPNASSNQAVVVVYLGGYAVECILKALVLSTVRPKRHQKLLLELKKSDGHNLEKLRARFGKAKRGARLPVEQARQFRTIRNRWSSEMRYGPWKMQYETAWEFLAAVDGLMNWACERTGDAEGGEEKTGSPDGLDL